MANMTVYAVVHRKGGHPYTESPEEQGLSDGPHLLRAFATELEAHRYQDAISEYSGDALTVAAFAPNDLRSVVDSATRIELCNMPAGSWAQSLTPLS